MSLGTQTIAVFILKLTLVMFLMYTLIFLLMLLYNIDILCFSIPKDYEVALLDYEVALLDFLPL